MDERTLKNYISTTKVYKIIGISIGLMIAAFGIALTYKTGIGTNPVATACDGLTKVLPIDFGQANILLNATFLFIALFVKRNKINIGTLIVVFTIGLYINLFIGLLNSYDYLDSYQIPMNILGTAIASLGISIVVKIDFGIGPLELITEVIIDKTKISYKSAKTLLDITLLLIGITLGGVYGLGTVINVVLTGMFMQMYLELFNRQGTWFNRIKEEK